MQTEGTHLFPVRRALLREARGACFSVYSWSWGTNVAEFTAADPVFLPGVETLNELSSE